MTLAAFVWVALIHLVAAMSPGPSFVVCVRTAVAEGFRTAVGLAFGFGLGALLWAAAALAGLALVFELVPEIFLALKLVGAAFLVWLGIRMWHNARRPLPGADDVDRPPRSAASAIRLGFLTFAANPKTAVFFGAVFVGLVPPDAPAGALALLLLVIFLNETLWYILVARIFSWDRARTAYGRAKTLVDRVFGGLMGAFGLRIALG